MCGAGDDLQMPQRGPGWLKLHDLTSRVPFETRGAGLVLGARCEIKLKDGADIDLETRSC